MNTEYKTDKGRIISESGVPLLPRWFCDDLVAIRTDEYGISAIQYFNPKTAGLPRVFNADMWGGIKLYINDNGEMNPFDFSNTVVMPYGFVSEWKYGDSVFKYEQSVVNNTVIMSVEPMSEVKKGLALSFEVYDAFCTLPRQDGDARYVSKIERVWDKWEYSNGYFTDFYTEGDGQTHITVRTNTKTEYKKRCKGFIKHILTAEISQSGKTIIAIALDSSRSGCMERADNTIAELENYLRSRNERYETVIEKAPVLKSPYKSLNDFVALAPLYHEANKVLSVPGAIRAKTEYYWVWGWDGMSSPYAYAYWGDADFLPKMLQMYMDTADPEKGIGHWFARDMSHIETSMIAAQGFYINLLYQHYINGGDITPYWEFAKKIFGLIKSVEADGLGLCVGNSLVPDFREVILENGNDLSCFNNVSAYCAVSALAEMAESIGDTEAQREAAAFAERTRANFKPLLFDEEKGFVASSADSITHEKRRVYNAMAIKWDNKYCADLTGDFNESALKFFEENFVCKAGLRCFPTWGIGFDDDANQAHCYWPAHTEYFARIINEQNRPDLTERLIGWISRWTDILACPEGINCYISSEKPFVDCWNAVNGAWQSYSMRAWYEAIVHSVVGVDIDAEGLTLYPYSGAEMSLSGLHYRDKIINITMCGSGEEIEYITLNGRKIESKRKILKEELAAVNDIIVKRKEKGLV